MYVSIWRAAAATAGDVPGAAIALGREREREFFVGANTNTAVCGCVWESHTHGGMNENECAAAQNITALPAQQPHQPRIDTADDAGATMNLFTPNYGAASSHIAELMKERDDFLTRAAIKPRAPNRAKDIVAGLNRLEEQLKSRLIERRAGRSGSSRR